MVPPTLEVPLSSKYETSSEMAAYHAPRGGGRSASSIPGLAETLQLAEAIVGKIPEGPLVQQRTLLVGRLASRIASLEAVGRRRRLSPMQEGDLAGAVTALAYLRHHEGQRDTEPRNRFSVD